MLRYAVRSSIGWLPFAFIALVLVQPTAAAAPVDDPKLAEARRLWLAGRYDEAEPAARKLLSATPNASVILARTLAETGRRSEAIKELRKSAKTWGPQAAYVHGELALLLFDSGEYDGATAAVTQAKVGKHLLPAAEWASAELHRVHGRLEEAVAGYDRLVERLSQSDAETDSESLFWMARAAIQQASWGEANGAHRTVVGRLIPRIMRKEPSYWPAQMFAAQLYAEKSNPAQAEAEIDRVLASNPNAPSLHALRGQLAIRRYDHRRAESALAKIRRVDAHSPAAQRLQAQIALQQWRFDDAIALLDKAKQANSRDERTLGMLAAAIWGRAGLHKPAPSTVTELMKEVESRNPHCVRFYESLAAQIVSMRKYPFAVEPYVEAIRRHPKRVGIRGQLGLLLMRLAREEEAKALLVTAFKNDPFNVRVKNMLEVLEVLGSYAVLESEHFVIRFDHGADGVLAEHAARYLEEEVYPEITKQLGFEPKGKSLIEIFSKSRNTSGHSWFSARMIGLPFVGTVGACAGRIVAITSPNDVKKKFSWARVLRHEFVHVVNLQQTNFHIPHWFTEAMAVLLEDAPRPAEWEEILARRHASASLFTLTNINSGFVRPKSSDDWTLAYCQSELYAEYLTNRYGQDALAKMLAAYADNQSTEQAVTSSFGATLETIESGYAIYVDKIVAAIHFKQQLEPATEHLERLVKDQPESAANHANLALARLKRNRKPAAREAALAAFEREPNEPTALFVLARLELSIGDEASAIARLKLAYDREAPNENVLLLLAALRLKNREFDEVADMMEVGAKSFPHPTRWLKQLARVHLKSGDNDALYSVLARLAKAEGDSLLYRRKLIQLASEADNHRDVIKWANQSLQIDVMDAGHHAQLGLAQLALGRSANALRSLKTATRLDPNPPSWRLGLARAAKAVGDRTFAKQILTELAAETPDYPGVRELLKEFKHD